MFLIVIVTKVIFKCKILFYLYVNYDFKLQIFISVVQHSLLNQKKEVIKVKIIVLKNKKIPKIPLMKRSTQEQNSNTKID